MEERPDNIVDLKRDEASGRFVPGTQPPVYESPRGPAEQAAAVATAEAMGSSEAARVTGIPRRTIRRWASDPHITVEERELARQELAEACERVAFQYIEHLSLDATVKGASARDAGTVVGIMLDKALKYRGEDKPNPLDQPADLESYYRALAAAAAGGAAGATAAKG